MIKLDTKGRKKICFDMDGTTIDSTLGWEDAIASTMKQFGGETDDEYYYMRKIAPPVGLAEYIHRKTGQSDTETVYRIIMEKVDRFYRSAVQPKPYVKEALRAFKEDGYTICLFTGTDRPQMELIMKNTGLFDLFDCTLTTQEAGAQKTDIESYQYAAKLLGENSASDIVMIDDLPKYLQKAQMAGCLTIGFYDEPAHPEFTCVQQYSDLPVIKHWRDVFD